MLLIKIKKIKNRFRAYPTHQAVQTTGSTALFWEPGTTLKELFNKRGALIILCSIIPSYLLFMFIGFIYGSIAGKNIGEPYME